MCNISLINRKKEISRDRERENTKRPTESTERSVNKWRSQAIVSHSTAASSFASISLLFLAILSENRQNRKSLWIYVYIYGVCVFVAKPVKRENHLNHEYCLHKNGTKLEPNWRTIGLPACRCKQKVSRRADWTHIGYEEHKEYRTTGPEPARFEWTKFGCLARKRDILDNK